MKKTYLFNLVFILLTGLGFIIATGNAGAQVVITQWTFEGDVVTPSTGSGTASLHGGTTATFATGLTGTGSGGRAWNTSGYPAQGTASGTAGVQFLVSTSGYSMIGLSWDGRHSNTSANRLRIQYTLNGTDWQNFEASAANATNTANGIDKGFDNGRYIADAGDTWYQRSASFAGISGAADNPAFGIRIVSEFVDGSNYGAATSTSTYGSNGTLRYDNVTFQGSGESPLLMASPGSLSGFTYPQGSGPSDIQNVTLSGMNLSPEAGAIVVEAPNGYEMTPDGGSTFADILEFTYSGGAFNGKVLGIRLAASLGAGSYTGFIAANGGSAPELTVSISGTVTTANPPEITSMILPQFIEGATPFNNNRVPMAFHASLSNLLPSSTYKYYNKVVSGSDGPEYNGAGNVIFVDPASGTFTRTTSPSLTTAGQHGELTTDAEGNWSGWFMTEPTGNARFKPGNEIYMRIMLNDGAGGTTEATRLTSAESIKVLGFYTHMADSTGTAINGFGAFVPKNFIFLYDNMDGTGRPLLGTQIETSGIEFIQGTHADFYYNGVAGTDMSWGGIVPNNNPAGVKRVEERSLADGSIVSAPTSSDGTWSGVDTRNPSGGLENVLAVITTLGTGSSGADQGNIFTYGNILSVELNSSVSGSIQLINLYGQEAARYPISGTTATITLSVPSGAYIVRILSDKGTFSRKVMVR